MVSLAFALVTSHRISQSPCWGLFVCPRQLKAHKAPNKWITFGWESLWFELQILAEFMPWGGCFPESVFRLDPAIRESTMEIHWGVCVRGILWVVNQLSKSSGIPANNLRENSIISTPSKIHRKPSRNG